MEAGCLIHAEMESVRHLHVISSQLVRLKRYWMPLLRVLYTLRDQDSVRASAFLGGTGVQGNGSGLNSGLIPTNGASTPMEGPHQAHEMLLPPNASVLLNTPSAQQKPFNYQQATGYISPTTKVG